MLVQEAYYRNLEWRRLFYFIRNVMFLLQSAVSKSVREVSESIYDWVYPYQKKEERKGNSEMVKYINKKSFLISGTYQRRLFESVR